MMRKNFLVFAALAAMALVGCQKSIDVEVEHKEPSQYIQIDTEVSSLTKVTDVNNIQEFENGDEISVYGWVGATFADINASELVVNSVNVLSDSKWTPTPKMLWKDMLSAHSFVSTYPVQTVTDFTAHPYDLSTASVKDLLFAVNTQGLKGNDDEVVSLEFDHAMSKVVVALVYRNEFEGNPDTQSVTIGATNESTINFFTKKVTPVGAKTDIALASTNGVARYESILVPQNITTVKINIGGVNYIYTHPADFVLEQGKIHTINLIVGKHQVELGSVSVNAWGDGNDIIDGEAQN